LFVLGTPKTTPSWAESLPILNDPRLKGGRVVVPMFYLSTTIFPVVTDSALLLTLGK
jgi:hypothetical protein